MFRAKFSKQDLLKLRIVQLKVEPQNRQLARFMDHAAAAEMLRILLVPGQQEVHL